MLSIKVDKILAWPSPTVAEIWVRNQMRKRGFVLWVWNMHEEQEFLALFLTQTSRSLKKAGSALQSLDQSHYTSDGGQSVGTVAVYPSGK